MKMILFMGWDFFIFILLYGLVLVIFAIVGTLLFDDVDNHY